MRAQDKRKMCPFCEGNIEIDAESCRFCGSSLLSAHKKSLSKAYETEESLASLYNPPYAPRRDNTEAKKEKEHQPFSKKETPKRRYAYEEYEEEKVEKAEEDSPEKIAEESAHIGSLLLLSIGAQLFTLGALLFFFSDHGTLTLEWKSRYWLLYVAISLPLLYHGWRKLRR